MHNEPINETTSGMIEKSKSEIGAEVKRQAMYLYNPEYIQLLPNPELEDELITLSLVDAETIRVTEEKKQSMQEPKSHDVTLIDCKKEVVIISFWRINEYGRPMCYRQH